MKRPCTIAKFVYGAWKPSGGPSFLSLPVPEALFTRFWSVILEEETVKVDYYYFGAVLDDIG